MVPDFLNEYWMYLAGVTLLSFIASYFSRKFFRYLKRTLLVIAVLSSLAAGYELVTGKSIFKLPGDIDRKLSEDLVNPETGRRYYQSIEERYGEEMPKK